MIGDNLKALRKRAGMTVRAVASELGYDAHSKYSYYESSRFKGPLPIDLARLLADMWEHLGVKRPEVMALAGLTHDQAVRESASATALKYQSTVVMEVLFPEVPAIQAMLKRMFDTLGINEISQDALHKMAFLLPYALRNTPTGKTDPYHDFELPPQFDKALAAGLERWSLMYNENWPD